MKVEARVEREPGEKNFSCLMEIESLKAHILGQGNSAKAAIDDMLNGWHDAAEYLKAGGKEVPELEIDYIFDVGSLFNYYDFINVAGVSREVGINSSVMRQYATGVRRPSAERRAKIENGLRQMAHKILSAHLAR